MGDEKQPPRVKLFFGLLFSDEEILARAEKRIINDYGEIDWKSAIVPFDKTSYYSREMGDTILRAFISAKTLMKPDNLPSVKLQTNALEKLFAQKDGRRKINIDPGYLRLSGVILATTKDYDHRLYLGDKIYGEVTLRYRGDLKSYAPWEWTYPDYKDPVSLEFFNHVRRIYKEQLLEKE